MKQQITIGEKYKPAMEMTDQAEAAKYFEECVQHSMSFGRSREEAENIERQNLGYFAGYYDGPTRARVERLFRCSSDLWKHWGSWTTQCRRSISAWQETRSRKRLKALGEIRPE